MNRLEIKETNNTPHIIMDSTTNSIIIEGKSFPEDSKEFYKSVVDWIDEYRIKKPKEVILTINLFYLSSSSIISIKQLLMKVEEMTQEGTKALIIWCYDEDDDDIKKTGEDYARLTKLTFEFKINS